MTDSSLRNHINDPEGTSQDVRNRNSKDSFKKKNLEVNYADKTLELAFASNEKDSVRFENQQSGKQKHSSIADKSTPTEFGNGDDQNNFSTEDYSDLDAYNEVDESDAMPNPSLGRFGLAMPVLNETESQIDLRDFNKLEPPEDTSTKTIQPSRYDNTPNRYDNTPHGYENISRLPTHLSSDRSEDYDSDTPNLFAYKKSCPIAQNYRRESSEEYQTPKSSRDFMRPPLVQVNSRRRSKTCADSSDVTDSKKTSRTYSEGDPQTPVEFDEHYFDEIETVHNPSIPTSDQTIAEYEAQMDYPDDLNGYQVLSPLNNINIGSIEGNQDDSDSDYDNFIHQHQEPLAQMPQEETRAQSPYYHQPISKSSLATYPSPPHIEKTASPKEVVRRQKNRIPEQQKRLTMPAHSMSSYEDYVVAPRPQPTYVKSKSSIKMPDPNLRFRPVQSARDSKYDTALTKRKQSIPEYSTNAAQFNPNLEEYRQMNDRGVTYRQPHAVQKPSFNRNRSTNHRNSMVYSRQDVISPQDSHEYNPDFDDALPYETTINASEIMNRNPQPEYAPHHYADYSHTPRSIQRRPPVDPNRIYATPHMNSVTPVNRNHLYVPANDTSPVQSLDSGIASLYNNDLGYRPQTAQPIYYHQDFDYDESPVDNSQNMVEMQEMVLELKNQLRFLSNKIQNIEGANQEPEQVMSPTAEYAIYSPNQLRSASVASSGSEGGRVRRTMVSPPQVRSPGTSRSPLPTHYQTQPRYSQPSQDYGMGYAKQREVSYAQNPRPNSRTRIPEMTHGDNRKPNLQTQGSAPNINTNRPSSIAKVISGTSQERVASYLTRPVTLPAAQNRAVPNRYGLNLPRAQSSTGTATYAPSPRLQTPRYKAGPQIKRSVSPQPMTSARKSIPNRPLFSSQSNRTSDSFQYSEDTQKLSRIPKPNQRFL